MRAIISKLPSLKNIFVYGKILIFVLQNKYLRIYEDSFGVKILRDDCSHSLYKVN